jgi:hypothetical protein
MPTGERKNGERRTVNFFLPSQRALIYSPIRMKKRWIVGCLLLAASFTQAKTRLLVEDPNNVVAGRYSLTSQQLAHAKQTAEDVLNSAKESDLQKALAVRLVAVDAGPLTPDQAAKEPDSLRNAQTRLAMYGVIVPDNRELRPIAIYDTQCHRIIHGRLYTVTELPRVHYCCRFDDYIAIYFGGGGAYSKEGYRK